MGIPHHRNLGDNAIAVAEKNILDNYFSNYERYEMPEENLWICAEKVKKLVKDDDIILLHGGGNIGDTYEKPEKGRSKVIQIFPDNKIIILPQTIYFSNTEEGRKKLEEIKKIYNAHKNLVMLAREKKSYKFMKKHFYNAKIYLTPDIVMTLKKVEDRKREGALLLFRNDIEKTLSDNDIKKIVDIVEKEYKCYKISDMNVKKNSIRNVAGAYRDRLLSEKFLEFQTSEIVITDRLHGMIFAAITETPCIVFSNFNHKIIESYEWLKNLEYIKFCNNINELSNLIDEQKNIKERKYDNLFAIDVIVNVLKEEII